MVICLCDCYLCLDRSLSTLYPSRPVPDIGRNVAPAGGNSALGKTPNYADSQLTIQYQIGLEIVVVGPAGQIYNVDDGLVLKACRVYQPASSNDTPRAFWDYASETLFHFGLLKDEKTVFRLLIEHPHPKIIEAIDIGHPEGIHLRKYQPLSGALPSTQPDRIAWYQDIMRALVHLHRFDIAHSDLRKDNILSDQKGHALLGGFSASCPFGHPNPSRPVLLNGPSETIPDATDRFAMGSLIYELETGVRPEISVDNHGSLSLPLVHTGHDGLDPMIENAWRGKYESTADMLKHTELLLNAGHDSRGPVEYKEELIGRINQWRRRRVEKHGCILYSLPNETQVKDLAERYGWDINEELRLHDFHAVGSSD
ncbi:hypothetical protein ANOM_006288 [Aspergillus nomiae NRRL 13137]|uniref:Protein kinase domain-containing protein n=1 Tax=Aspergillus nomiae NRRL (strain ATCC 15546 / NRRL 13137 / CBS 260.88 / M93) TaxID=1509407 RepID=A0A0L1J1P4_ASPN3|nr:uncharacterized protein ANOM_006288 [Aspergillus nomiae NRRL 13137]KNG85338.1 hypothetical protein ANOM_006288 [Aspergillus nomiae NRRL 13137]